MPAMTEERLQHLRERTRYWKKHFICGNEMEELLTEIECLRAVEQAARGVLAAQGTSGLDEALAALRVALEGEG